MIFQCFSKACRERVGNMSKPCREIEISNENTLFVETKRKTYLAKAQCPHCKKKLSKFVTKDLYYSIKG